MSNLASLYSSRGGLEPESPVFVGRDDTLRDIFVRLSGSNKNLPGVAVVGPRRFGKTSLLKQLLSPAVRSRYVDNPDGWHVAYMDASGRRWTGFGDFRSSALGALGIASGQQGNSHDCFSEGVQRIMASVGGKTTLLLLDEFNYIAPQLGKDEQAELRSAVDNLPGFSLVVGVAQRPDDLLEHIPYDEASELAPVLNLALPYLASLSVKEAHDLVRAGRIHADLDPDEEAEEWVVRVVGTHPLLLHAACFAWYRAVGARTLGELSAGERDTAERNIHAEVSPHWQHIAHALRGSVRSLVFGQIDPGSDIAVQRAERVLEEFGLTIWFRQSGSLRPEEGVGPTTEPALDVADQLMSEIEGINARHQLLVKRVEWVFRTDRLAGNDGIYLRRHVDDREGFASFIGALARLMYDGSQGVVPPKLRGQVKPVLPGWCYKDSRSVVVDLLALRNYHTHLLAPDPQLAAEHLESAGDVFERYCKKRAPEAGDLETVRIGLLTSAVNFVKKLNELLPVQADLKSDDFFASLPTNRS
jgi:hypothetical protein